MRLSRRGIKKTIYLDRLWDETVKDYAKKTGLSQSDVIERLMLWGDREFRKRFRLDEKSNKSKAKDRADAVKQQREKREREWQEARKKRLRDIILDYEHVDESQWTRVE